MITPQFVADGREVMDYACRRSLRRKIILLTGIVGSAVFLTAQTAVPTPAQMVDALHSAFSQHHTRAVHAKGVLVEGYFMPALTARSLTIAPICEQKSGRWPVIARFSDFTGLPAITDINPLAYPRGFAIKFRLPEGASSDIVSHSFNCFPVATAAEFRQLLLAANAAASARLWVRAQMRCSDVYG